MNRFHIIISFRRKSQHSKVFFKRENGITLDINIIIIFEEYYLREKPIAPFWIFLLWIVNPLVITNMEWYTGLSITFRTCYFYNHKTKIAAEQQHFLLSHYSKISAVTVKNLYLLICNIHLYKQKTNIDAEKQYCLQSHYNNIVCWVIAETYSLSKNKGCIKIVFRFSICKCWI